MSHYLFVDIILTITQFVSNLGGDVDKLTADVHEIENILDDINSIDQIREEMIRLFTSAITFRNSQASHERVLILQQAKDYIDMHYFDPDLKMNTVAQKFNISPSHFSTIFHREIGVTFREYIGKLRINRAKELLRTTNLKCSEVAHQSGYKDSHYFSYVFKKKTGINPRQFRAQSQDISKME
jgi:two-component system response regulator YesN